MPDLQPDASSGIPADAEGPVRLHEEAGTPERGPEATEEQNDGSTLTVNVHTDGSHLVSITEASAQLLLSILDTLSFKGSESKLRAGIAQKELELGLGLISKANDDQPKVHRLPRASRRALEKEQRR